MTMNKKIFAILAIFLIFASMSIISAADNATDNPDQDDNATEDIPDEDIADDDPGDVGDNPYRHGALTPNEKAFLEDAPHAAGGESKAISATGSPTTGNPILVLLAAIAVLGAYPLRHK